MKKYVFEYDEICRGTIVVYTENEDDALEMAHCGDGDIHIYKSQEDIGALIEETDVEN